MKTKKTAQPGTILATEWREFANAVLPETVGDVQRTEMRRAFYAGANALLSAMMKFLDPGDEANRSRSGEDGRHRCRARSVRGGFAQGSGVVAHPLWRDNAIRDARSAAGQ
jgi:hypothetical protein